MEILEYLSLSEIVQNRNIIEDEGDIYYIDETIMTCFPPRGLKFQIITQKKIVELTEQASTYKKKCQIIQCMFKYHIDIINTYGTVNTDHSMMADKKMRTVVSNKLTEFRTGVKSAEGTHHFDTIVMPTLVQLEVLIKSVL